VDGPAVPLQALVDNRQGTRFACWGAKALWGSACPWRLGTAVTRLRGTDISLTTPIKPQFAAGPSVRAGPASTRDIPCVHARSRARLDRSSAREQPETSHRLPCPRQPVRELDGVSVEVGRRSRPIVCGRCLRQHVLLQRARTVFRAAHGPFSIAGFARRSGITERTRQWQAVGAGEGWMWIHDLTSPVLAALLLP
jgi:hypothetical protein